MLEQLRLRNFQVHESINIDLDPLVTSIIGRSDAGKSAVLRALRWLCFNRPAGESFIRHDAQTVQVSLLLDGGHKVSHRKGTKRGYRVDGLALKAYGSNVPDEVARLLNVGEVNFQGQHDAPFWFSDTPGQVSRALNQIVDLGAIDKALADVSNKIHRAKAAADQAAQDLAEARRHRARSQWVVEATATLNSLSSQNDETLSKALKIAHLAPLLDRARQATRETKRHRERIRAFTGVVDRARGLWGRGQRVVDLSTLLTAAQVAQDAASLRPDTRPLSTAAAATRQAQTKYENLGALLHQLKGADRLWHDTTDQLRPVKAALAKANRCPTCGRPTQRTP